MNTPSATKQYIINQLPDDPSQITTGSFVDTSNITINYLKVGKLYFGFWANEISGEMAPIAGIGSSQYTATINRLCSQLGITLNTAYTNSFTPTIGGVDCFYWNGSAWTGASASSYYGVLGILAN